MSKIFDDGAAKVETYRLGDSGDKVLYENILNNFNILKEEFIYDKQGSPIVTVWYIDDGDGPMSTTLENF